MGLNRKSEDKGKNNDSQYTQLPVGEVEGRLVYVADLGLQSKEYAGEYQGDIQQLSLGIEIVDHPHDTENGPVARLMWIKPFYIYSRMGSKSKEFEYYSIFNPSAKPETVPNWEAQLGKPVSVNIVHTKSGDKVYDNVGKINSIPAKYQDGVTEATLTPAIGDSDDEENVVTQALYGLTKYVYDKRIVKESAKPQQSPAGEDFDDDIPF